MALQAVFLGGLNFKEMSLFRGQKYENYRTNTLLKRSGYKFSRNVVNCVGLKIAVNKVAFFDEFQTKGIFPGSVVRFSAF